MDKWKAKSVIVLIEDMASGKKEDRVYNSAYRGHEQWKIERPSPQ